MRTKSLLLALLCTLLCAFSASAYDFMVDGIAYNYNSNGSSVSVTAGGNYTGEICIPDEVTYNGTTYSVTLIADNAFMGCSKLKYVELPYSVTSIGVSAFNGCTLLDYVDIPYTLTSIGSGAFAECIYLTEVTIPSSVTSIGQMAFINCRRLRKINSYPNPAKISMGSDHDVFYGVPKNGTLHVLPKYLQAYSAADQWNEFTNIHDDLREGDVNCDSRVNVSDVTMLVNMIIGLHPVSLPRADINGDGRVNVSDVTALINIILGIE